MQCPICDKQDEEIQYPVIDAVTGWKFCNGCYKQARDYIDVVFSIWDNSDNLVIWLRAIAAAREVGIKANAKLSK